MWSLCTHLMCKYLKLSDFTIMLIVDYKTDMYSYNQYLSLSYADKEGIIAPRFSGDDAGNGLTARIFRR